MDKPYIVCHMMAALDGRIDCGMTAKLPGVDEYYATLDALDVPTTLSGRTTAKLELTDEPDFDGNPGAPIGREAFHRAAATTGYSVVVDTKGTLGWKDGMADGKPLIVVTSQQAGEKYLQYLTGRQISWISCGCERIDLRRAVEIMYAEFGVRRMGVVGGGRINAGFLNAGLLNEISLLIAPGIDGRAGQPCAFDGLPTDSEPFRLILKSAKAYECGCVWLRYEL